MRNLNNETKNAEKIFVIFTDVVDSCRHDAESESDFITWRTTSFSSQLQILLNSKEREIVKSIGDALFIKSIFKNKPTKQSVEDLLTDILKVFEVCKEQKPIRMTIHCLNGGYSNGIELAEKLKEALANNKAKSLYEFIKNLKYDLFGTDISKAARIQSLAKKPAILVSQEVIELLELDKESKEYQFGFCILHHPVPITYLKGIFDYSKKLPNGKESKEYHKVWELSNINSKDNFVLAHESKSFHALRFLNAEVNFNPPKSESELNEYIAAIHRESNVKIFAEESAIELRDFHTDIKYRIHDIFTFSKITFTRPSNKKFQPSPFENLVEFKRTRASSGESANTVICQSLLKRLALTRDNNSSIKCTIEQKQQEEFSQEDLSFIPNLVITSFPNQETASKLRSIYSYKAIGNLLAGEKIKHIEPQTLQVYKHIIIEEENNLERDGSAILLFYGVYNEYIYEADEENGIFNMSDVEGMTIFAKGIISGLVDGFIIYQSSPEQLLKGIENLLNNLFKRNTSRTKTFFNKVFPISIFTLSVEDFNPNNIKILKKFKVEKGESS